MGEGYTSALDVLGGPEAAEETRRFWKQSAEGAANQREPVDAFVRETIASSPRGTRSRCRPQWRLGLRRESAAEGSAPVAARRL